MEEEGGWRAFTDDDDEPSVGEEESGWAVLDDDEPSVGDEEDGWGRWADEPLRATTPHAAKRARREEAGSSHARERPDGAALAPALTVDDPDTLNCGVCFLQLRAPIFQCKVGHMLCSMCHDKLKTTLKCYMCGTPIPEAGYSRCHGMENLVECIRVQCPNAAYGCTIRPAYYDQHSHCRTCPHAPCHCPGKACRFAGSIAALLKHIACEHGWPIITIKSGDRCSIDLCEGFNFLVAGGDIDLGQGPRTSTPTTAGNQRLFLVNVARQPLDHVISVLCIDSHRNADAKVIECNLTFSNIGSNSGLYGGAQTASHYQDSTFRVACTDLTGGLLDLRKCFRFVVPNCVTGDHEEYFIRVQACIMIH